MSQIKLNNIQADNILAAISDDCDDDHDDLISALGKLRAVVQRDRRYPVAVDFTEDERRALVDIADEMVDDAMFKLSAALEFHKKMRRS